MNMQFLAFVLTKLFRMAMKFNNSFSVVYMVTLLLRKNVE